MSKSDSEDNIETRQGLVCDDRIILLTVRDKLFRTTLSPLSSPYRQSNYFTSLLSGRWQVPKLPDGSHFINRSPMTFEVIHDWLCGIPLELDPNNTNFIQHLIIDAEFYGFSDLVDQIKIETHPMHNHPAVRKLDLNSECCRNEMKELVHELQRHDVKTSFSFSTATAIEKYDLLKLYYDVREKTTKKDNTKTISNILRIIENMIELFCDRKLGFNVKFQHNDATQAFAKWLAEQRGDQPYPQYAYIISFLSSIAFGFASNKFFGVQPESTDEIPVPFYAPQNPVSGFISPQDIMSSDSEDDVLSNNDDRNDDRAHRSI